MSRSSLCRTHWHLSTGGARSQYRTEFIRQSDAGRAKPGVRSVAQPNRSMAAARVVEMTVLRTCKPVRMERVRMGDLRSCKLRGFAFTYSVGIDTLQCR